MDRSYSTESCVQSNKGDIFALEFSDEVSVLLEGGELGEVDFNAVVLYIWVESFKLLDFSVHFCLVSGHHAGVEPLCGHLFAQFVTYPIRAACDDCP